MSIFSNISFYGGGAWGQALAITLASVGQKSTLIVSDQVRANEINNHYSRKFPQNPLHSSIQANTDSNEILKRSDLVFITTESKRVLKVLEEVSLFSSNGTDVVVTSKGSHQKMVKPFLK